MSGYDNLHLTAVDDQRVFVINAEVGVEVPSDGAPYSLSQVVYGATLNRLENIEGTKLDPGTYAVVLTAVVTKADLPLQQASDPAGAQLNLPFASEDADS